jgi:transposase-like protein
MGNTLCLWAGGVDAGEGVSGDGGTFTLVARLLEGEGMSEVCRAFGISRKTGYKIFSRYKDQGLDAQSLAAGRPQAKQAAAGHASDRSLRRGTVRAPPPHCPLSVRVGGRLRERCSALRFRSGSNAAVRTSAPASAVHPV